MKVAAGGTVFASAADTDGQSCAFPQIAVLPSGRWLCACRAARTKVSNQGQHVRISVSDDEGETWSQAAAPFEAPRVDGKPGQFRTAALTSLGGERVVAVLYWMDSSDPDLPFFNEQTEGLLDSRIMLAESADSGHTWSTPELVNTSPFTSPTPITGPILRLPNGEWVCQFELNKPYDDTTPWVHASVLMFSADEGRTWLRSAVVSRDPLMFYWDQRPNVLPNGRILDVFWTYNSAAAMYVNIHACESMDDGRTWSDLWDTGVPGQPASVISLADGRLAMVYVDRTGAPAIRCRLSDDGGRSWPESHVSSIYESGLARQVASKGGMADTWSEMGKFSLGLPAVATIPNGDVLVVYYAGPDTDHTNVMWARCCMAREAGP